MFKNFIFLILLILILSPLVSFASSLSGYAWSSNVGWFKFSGSNYGVDLDDSMGKLSGYAWSPNVGWLKFNNTDIGEWSGGLVKLSGIGYSVSPDYDLCRLTGWAWGSDVIGWVRFSGSGYGVVIDDCSSIEPLIEKPVCQFSASPIRVSKGGKSVLSWNCNGTADFCSIPNAGLENVIGVGQIQTGPLLQTTDFNLQCSNSGGTSNYTAKVQVVVPAYCEIIPFLGTCR